MIEMGAKIRKQRRRLGLTLEDLAGRTGISKPYLSLIETGRVANPPSDEKLRRLELALQFASNELLSQANLQRTPRDVRVILQKLLEQRQKTDSERTNGERTNGEKITGERINGGKTDGEGKGDASQKSQSQKVLGSVVDPLMLTKALAGGTVAFGGTGGLGGTGSFAGSGGSHGSGGVGGAINLDEAYLSGMLASLAERLGGNIEPVNRGQRVPVINRVSAGYPRDFTDLAYPPKIADDYIGCIDLQDNDAFAARVYGDSMMPKYRQGDIVVFSPAAAFKNGDDCFVRFEDGQTTFKRVFYEAATDGEQVVRLQPRNEKYPPRVLKQEEIAGIYKAVLRYERLD